MGSEVWIKLDDSNAGAASGNRLTLKTASPAAARSITYLVDAHWSPNNLLYGQNGIAALTFAWKLP